MGLHWFRSLKQPKGCVYTMIVGVFKYRSTENANSEFTMAPSVAQADAILASFGYQEAVLA